MKVFHTDPLEDKIVQKTVTEILNCIYEEDFLGFSYGFRPGLGQHDALDALSVGITGKRVNWILDADIEGFFDTIDHEWLIKFLEHRIGDKRVLQLIRKWLRAGIIEDCKWLKTKLGTPQVSPVTSKCTTCDHFKVHHLGWVFSDGLRGWLARS